MAQSKHSIAGNCKTANNVLLSKQNLTIKKIGIQGNYKTSYKANNKFPYLQYNLSKATFRIQLLEP